MDISLRDDVQHVTASFYGRRFIYSVLTEVLGFDITEIHGLSRNAKEWDVSRYSGAMEIYGALVEEAPDNYAKMLEEARKGDYNDD